jgi:hypothetical protein
VSNEQRLVIGECRKNSREVIRVFVGPYNGRWYVSARWFGQEEGQGEGVDLNRGFSLVPTGARELARLLGAASDEIERQGGRR